LNKIILENSKEQDNSCLHFLIDLYLSASNDYLDHVFLYFEYESSGITQTLQNFPQAAKISNVIASIQKISNNCKQFLNHD
jgi:hypothetical protein